MLLFSLLANTILALFTMATAEATSGPGPISETTIPITHRTILSQRSFADTKAAFEAAIPPLNNTFRDLLLAGNPAGALAALQALPPLNSFVVPPRDFGALVRVQGVEGAQAVQYEIGNPLTASEVARFDLGVSLYAPIRVSLLQDPTGKVKFVYDTPISTFGQFAKGEHAADIKKVAAALDHKLVLAFLFAGGWPAEWPLPAGP